MSYLCDMDNNGIVEESDLNQFYSVMGEYYFVKNGISYKSTSPWNVEVSNINITGENVT